MGGHCSYLLKVATDPRECPSKNISMKSCEKKSERSTLSVNWANEPTESWSFRDFEIYPWDMKTWKWNASNISRVDERIIK